VRTSEEVQAVLHALENPKYKWRTISGIAKEVGLSLETVHEVIAENKDQIVRSSVPSADGEALYTTRDHYRRSASITDKLLGMLKNRAD
jgi:hypothetical protein